MNEQKFYELMGDIDPEIIAAADKPVPFRKKRGFKIALIAAVLAFAIFITPIAGAFALVIGYSAPDPDVDSDQVSDTEQNDGKPTGLIGELFGNMNWGALGDAIGKDGNVNWGAVWDVLRGKEHEPTLDGNVYKSVKLDDGTMKITAFVSGSNQTVIEVPETLSGAKVTVIGEGAFAENQSITHVSLPDTVTKIEDKAFYACNSLVSVDLSINLREIGNQAFSDCNYLSSMNLPYALRTIGDFAFANTALTKITIRPTLTNWGETPFFSSRLQSVEILDGVTAIPAGAFCNTPNLKEIEIPSSVIEIGDLAFAECTGLSEITLNDGLQTVGAGAFDGTAITEITIPATVTDMYDVYFLNCVNLQKVTFLGDAPTVESTHLWYTSWRPEDVLYPYYDVYYSLGAQGFSDFWHVFKAQLSPLTTQPYVTECGLETVPFYAEVMLGTSGTSYFEGDVLVLNSYKQFQAIGKKISSLYESDITFDSTYFEQFSVVLIKVTHSSSEDIIGVAGLAHDQRDPQGDALYPVIIVNSPAETNDDILHSYIAVAISTTDSSYSDSRVYVYNLNPENQNGDSAFHKHFPDAFVTLD
ncbi:MAG: leucine-rich repeat domain-containing protein [Clostridia bacterium]|nr:leucine-rich repeat domain-containing protein [Clostridia bacterium]